MVRRDEPVERAAAVADDDTQPREPFENVAVAEKLTREVLLGEKRHLVVPRYVPESRVTGVGAVHDERDTEFLRPCVERKPPRVVHARLCAHAGDVRRHIRRHEPEFADGAVEFGEHMGRVRFGRDDRQLRGAEEAVREERDLLGDHVVVVGRPRRREVRFHPAQLQERPQPDHLNVDLALVEIVDVDPRRPVELLGRNTLPARRRLADRAPEWLVGTQHGDQVVVRRGRHGQVTVHVQHRDVLVRHGFPHFQYANAMPVPVPAGLR